MDRVVTAKNILLFTFGKYRHRPMKEVLSFDPRYIVWAYENVQHHGIPVKVYQKAKGRVVKHKKMKVEKPLPSWLDTVLPTLPEESRPVYFADGSGYLPSSGPCGPLYFDEFGNP